MKPYVRQSRWDTKAKGKPIVIQPRDLDFLYQLFIHGKLSSAMLRALVAPEVGQKRITDRLMKLKLDGLIEQPFDQRFTTPGNPNSMSLIRQLTNTGIQVLIDHDRITRNEARWYYGINDNTNHLAHDIMTAYLTASVQLGCDDKRLGFVSIFDVLKSSDCPQSTKNAKNPLAIPYEDDEGKQRFVIPDALFGIENSQGINFYALETDRKNEPIETAALKRSSYAGHILGYRRILRQSLYEKHFGIPNLQVLTVTVSSLHMLNIVNHLERETKIPRSDLTSARPFLFKTVREFGRRSSDKPPISGHVLTSPWQRVGEANVSLHK